MACTIKKNGVSCKCTTVTNPGYHYSSWKTKQILEVEGKVYRRTRSNDMAQLIYKFSYASTSKLKFIQITMFQFISFSLSSSCWLSEQHPMPFEGHALLAGKRKRTHIQASRKQTQCVSIPPVGVELWHSSLPHLA